MLRTIANTIMFVGLLSFPLGAQSNQPTASSSSATSESIIEQIKKAVVFIQGSYTSMQMQVIDGAQRSVAVPATLSGTGFLIFVPDSRLGPERGETFLVTNKHMIREPGANGILGEGPYFNLVSARMNKKQASTDGSMLATFPVTVVDGQGSLEWFVDGDESVDLAITPIGLDNLLDFKTLQRDLFATQEVLNKEQVSENDEIFFAGLFAWSPGLKKNLPIIRHGKLARLLEEPIPLDRTQPQKTVQVHLAEVMSFGGNSGSLFF